MSAAQSDALDFSSLKTWIKNFKRQHTRDPYFEDFPGQIGTQTLPAIGMKMLLSAAVSLPQHWNGSGGKRTSSKAQHVSCPSTLAKPPRYRCLQLIMSVLQARVTRHLTMLLAMVPSYRLQELPACTHIQQACRLERVLPVTQTLLLGANSTKVLASAFTVAAAFIAHIFCSI